jgi:hypothetical protein
LHASSSASLIFGRLEAAAKTGREKEKIESGAASVDVAVAGDVVLAVDVAAVAVAADGGVALVVVVAAVAHEVAVVALAVVVVAVAAAGGVDLVGVVVAVAHEVAVVALAAVVAAVVAGTAAAGVHFSPAQQASHAAPDTKSR